MRNDIYIVCAAIGILLCACTTRKERDAADEIERQIYADSYSIEFQSHGHTGSGGHTTIHLAFERVGGGVGDAEFSHSAYYYYKRVGTKEHNYDSICIDIGYKTTRTKRTFPVSDILLVDSLKDEVGDRFFQLYHSDSIRDIVDMRLDNDDLRTIVSFMGRKDSAYGPMKDVLFQGFYFYPVEKGEERQMGMQYDVENGKMTTPYAVYFSVHTRKVVKVQSGESRVTTKNWRNPND